MQFDITHLVTLRPFITLSLFWFHHFQKLRRWAKDWCNHYCKFTGNHQCM